MYIKLDSVEKVKEFNRRATRLHQDIDLVSGRYIIDAKSLLGIFSLDLSKPIKLQTYSEDDEQIAVQEFEEFRYENSKDKISINA